MREPVVRVGGSSAQATLPPVASGVSPRVENQLGPIVLWILRSVKHKCENALSEHFKSLVGSKVLTGFQTSNGLGSGFIVIGVLSVGNQFAIMWQPDGFQRKHGRRPIDLKEHNQDLLIKILLGES